MKPDFRKMTQEELATQASKLYVQNTALRALLDLGSKGTFSIADQNSFNKNELIEVIDIAGEMLKYYHDKLKELGYEDPVR